MSTDTTTVGVARSREAIVLQSMVDDVVTLEDGYQYFHTHRGGLSASDLRVIADELDRGNAEWDKKVKASLEGESCQQAK